MKQLTATEEVDKISDLLKGHIKDLPAEQFGADHLKVCGELILFSLRAYRAEADAKNPNLRAHINRQFASNILLCAEAGLTEFIVECCRCSVLNKRELSAFSYASSLQRKANDLLTPKEKNWLKGFKGKRLNNPEFFDLLDFVFDEIPSGIAVKDRKHIRRFFELLILIRNKASHLDVTLKPHEVALINEFTYENPSNDPKFQVHAIEDAGLIYFSVTFIFFHQMWWHIKDIFKLFGQEANVRTR